MEAAPAPVEAPAVPAEEAVPAAEPAAEEPAEASVEEDASADEEVPLDIAADPRLQAAVDYLTPIFKLMGVEEFSFTAVKKGEATILHVTGEHMGALIGRRGETMESLSYLASLVINRMEGSYVKLGLDVGGYRNKREDDLSALAKRIADRVIRTGCYYEMEPMNPYERHIIHTAIADIEGVRSESKGEGPTRHIVIYSRVVMVVVPAVTAVAVPAAEARIAMVVVPAVMAAAPTAALVPACRAVSLQIVPATPMLSPWPPRPQSASTTAMISPSARSSFNLLFLKEK